MPLPTSVYLSQNKSSPRQADLSDIDGQDYTEKTVESNGTESFHAHQLSPGEEETKSMLDISVSKPYDSSGREGSRSTYRGPVGDEEIRPPREIIRPKQIEISKRKKSNSNSYRRSRSLNTKRRQDSYRRTRSTSNVGSATAAAHHAQQKKSTFDDWLSKEASKAFEILERDFGMDQIIATGDLVLVMEAWNKCLAFKDMFSEAMFNRWRLLVAYDKLTEDDADDSDSVLGSSNRSAPRSGYGLPKETSEHLQACKLLEECKDVISLRLGSHMEMGRELLMGLLDICVRSLCPHTQVVQREAYRPLNDDLQLEESMRRRMGLKLGTAEEYFQVFARRGITPRHWLHFCDAFLWAMSTHSPYANETDQEDLQKPKVESAMAQFVSTHVAKEAIKGSMALRTELSQPVFKYCIPRFWKRVGASEASRALIGETFYRELLTNHPDFLDYFSNADMDSLALHFVLSLDLLVNSIDKIGQGGTKFRSTVDHLGEMHRQLKIPSNAFPVIGGQLIKTLTPFLQEEEQITKLDDSDDSETLNSMKPENMPVTAEELTQAFALLYTELMALVAHPMQREEKLVAEAEDFIRKVGEELDWTPGKLESRLLEVKLEISASGTYTHSTEELKMGARLAWRNSAKCIGRIAWDTLEVRDCRHINEPGRIFREVERHLKVATGADSIQSVMTVFRPRAPTEAWGLRFWNSQFVRYAGYSDEGADTPADSNMEGFLDRFHSPENLQPFDEKDEKKHRHKSKKSSKKKEKSSRKEKKSKRSQKDSQKGSHGSSRAVSAALDSELSQSVHSHHTDLGRHFQKEDVFDLASSVHTNLGRTFQKDVFEELARETNNSDPFQLASTVVRNDFDDEDTLSVEQAYDTQTSNNTSPVGPTEVKPKRSKRLNGVYRGKNPDGVLGDPANLEFTKYLVARGLFTPPEHKTGFDVLPLVLKIPGKAKPYVHELHKEFVHEVHIEHPTCEAVGKMGLRWAAIPAISNFNMNLGGINYNCCPFNGWFVSIEIVRNLMERYQINDRFAEAMGLDPRERMIEMRLQHEIQLSILHSFDKSGFTIVDPAAVGKSFLVHCKRERDSGRECPGQWSWIGGLVGPTNVTWHHEMRDFYVAPQYEYASEPWMVTDLSSSKGEELPDWESMSVLSASSMESLDNISMPRVLIGFGSQTGNAEAAAFKLARVLKLLKPIVMPLNEITGLTVIKEQNITHFFVICSTFNCGEFPSNANFFGKTPILPGSLVGKQFAVLALGSSMYPDFCMAGVKLNGMLSRGGGNSLMSIKKADEANGGNATISQWIQLVERVVLPKHLAAVIALKKQVSSLPPVQKLHWKKANGPETVANFDFLWPEGQSSPCIENEELLGNGDINERSTRKITFKLKDGVSYQSGDHLAVQPLNSSDMVERFGMCFQVELLKARGLSIRAPSMMQKSVIMQMRSVASVITVENGEAFPAQMSFSMSGMSLYHVLQSRVDLTLHDSTVEGLARLMAQLLKQIPEDSLNSKLAIQKVDLDHLLEGILLATDAEQRELETTRFLALYPTVVDFLEDNQELFLSHKRPLLKMADLLIILPRLRERLYSISSSPQVNPSHVTITVGVVHVKTNADVPVHGVCSNYLARLVAGRDQAMVSVHTSQFRGPPNEPSSSSIMIGPGTGLSPMMGFLCDRVLAWEKARREGEEVEVGTCHLFTGCRSVDDRIYDMEIDEWAEKGIIKHHLALSRAKDVPKTYVQDLVRKQGAEICTQLLLSDTYFYVCGDARVGQECYEACVQVLRKYGHMSRVGAVQHLRKMRAHNRWQHDLWGNFTAFNEPTRKSMGQANPNIRSGARAMRSAKTWLLSFVDNED